MEPVRYGIVGLGQVSMKGHVPELLGIPDTQITALCDPNDDALSQAAQLVPDARHYHEYDVLLKDKEIDVVLIATPNWLHKDQAISASRAGKHVFLEKPIGVDLDLAVGKGSVEDGDAIDVAVKVVDIFGNDTTHLLEVKI